MKSILRGTAFNWGTHTQGSEKLSTPIALRSLDSWQRCRKLETNSWDTLVMDHIPKCLCNGSQWYKMDGEIVKNHQFKMYLEIHWVLSVPLLFCLLRISKLIPVKEYIIWIHLECLQATQWEVFHFCHSNYMCHGQKPDYVPVKGNLRTYN